MAPAGEPLRERSRCSTPRSRWAPLRTASCPWSTHSGRWRGVVTDRAVAEALTDDESPVTTVADLVEVPDAVRADDDLLEALPSLQGVAGAVPVLDAGRERVVGWLDAHSALAALVARALTTGRQGTTSTGTSLSSSTCAATSPTRPKVPRGGLVAADHHQVRPPLPRDREQDLPGRARLLSALGPHPRRLGQSQGVADHRRRRRLSALVAHRLARGLTERSAQRAVPHDGDDEQRAGRGGRDGHREADGAQRGR